METDRIEVGELPDGCKVYVARRAFGAFAEKAYGSCAVGAFYWTCIRETMPGRAKWMALGTGRRFYASHLDADDRGAARAHAMRMIEMDAEEAAAIAALHGGAS